MPDTATLFKDSKVKNEQELMGNKAALGQNAKNAITVSNLSKNYKDFDLNKISFQVPKGSIMGFVGENGAGKTTTLKAILGLIRIDSGNVTVMGAASGELPNEIKQKIGVVFDGSNLHDTLSVNHLNIIMKNVYGNWDEKIFKDYVRKFQLPERKVIKEYSRGMKMKLSIAIALSHHSRLLILDEATSGLDPMVREEILDIFLEFIQDEENSILLSSHIISDIEKVADYVTFIHKGNIIFSDNKDDLIYRHGMVHCRREDVAGIDKAFVAGIRESSFGADVLIREKAAFERRYRQFNAERVTIEEIMLFISRGRETL
jgi:ABC-2 type transport system ATP-binding protein